MKISVAIAVYNGARYIRCQLDSILSQLDTDDEVYVSVDPSTDNSLAYIKELSRQDKRIKVIEGPGQGVMKNFENAISKCQGDIIFLADQDDRWKDNKVELVMEVFNNPQVKAVLHDSVITDDSLDETIIESFFEYKGCREGFLRNIIKNSFMGCCMAFRRELIEDILPFPANIPMHDQWIGLVAYKRGQVVFLRKQLLEYRRHENNVTKLVPSSLINMIKWRVEIIINILKVR